MKKRKLFSLLCGVMLGFSCFSSGFAYAEDTEPEVSVWDGKNVDKTWYDDEEKEFHITSASQLAGFFSLVEAGNWFKNCTIYLDNDFDMNHIQNYANIGGVFKGILKGNHHTIFNYYRTIAHNSNKNFDQCSLEDYWSSYVDYSLTCDVIGGLFSTMEGEISDLNLDGGCEIIDTNGSHHVLTVGGICGVCRGTIKNCNISNSTVAIRVNNLSKATYSYTYLNSDNRAGRNEIFVGGIGCITGCAEKANIISCSSSSNEIVYIKGSAEKNFYASFDTAGICWMAKDSTISCCSCNYTDIKGADNKAGLTTSGTYLTGSVVNTIAVGCRNSQVNCCYGYGSLCYDVSDSIFSACYQTCSTQSMLNRARNCVIIHTYSTGATMNDGSKNRIVDSYCLAGSITKNQGGGVPITKSAVNMQKQEFAERLGYPFVYSENDYPKLACEKGEILEGKTILFGDVNWDQKVDIEDIKALEEFLLSGADPASKILADLDYNGKLNAIDLTLLKQMIIQ